MNNLLPAIVFSLTLTAQVNAQTDVQQLKEQIKSFIANQGTIAVAFRDLLTGEEIMINESETFHAASTMKTPVLIEVFKQAKEGKLSLSDSIRIRNEFQSIVDGSMYSLNPADDSEQKMYGLVGKKKALKDLVNAADTSSIAPGHSI